MPGYFEAIRRSLSGRGFKGHPRIAEQAVDYVESTLGYPCYAKPNFGSQGRGVIKCEEPQELETAIREFQNQHLTMFLLERAVDMPDFRVVVFGNEVISCYRRIPLRVVGDGVSSLEHLLAEKQALYFEQGRDEVINAQDPRILARLRKNGLNMQSVLPPERTLQLLDVSNLSMGGESEEFTHLINKHWRELAIAITGDMGLRLCGVDLACKDLQNSDVDYSILEINAAPGLDNYAASGPEQSQRVRELYKKIFNELNQK